MITNKYGFVAKSFVCLLLLAATGLSQSITPRSGDAPVHPQTVNATTIVLVRLSPDQLQLPNWLRDAESVGPESEMGKARDAATTAFEWLKQVAGKGQFYVSVDVPYTSSQSVVRIMVDKREPEQLDSLRQELAKYVAGTPVIDGDFVVASPTHSLEEARYELDEMIMPAARPGFDQAANAVSEFPVQILVVPPRYLSDTFDELLPQLPDQLGGGPTSVLTKGIRWAAIGAEPKPTQIVAKIQSDSPQAAETLANRLPALVKGVLGQMPEHHRAAIGPISEAMLRSMKTTVVEDQIHIAFDSLDSSETPVGFLSKALDSFTGSLTRTGNKNRLRSIVLGIVNYESATGSMPPAKEARDADGKSNLSWRVHILPFLDEKELYSQFHLDEPWDSPHNLKLLDQMPKVFDAYMDSILSRPAIKPGYTCFLAPVGEATIFGGDEVTKIRDVQDGTSKTLAVVEVKPELAVPWTAPLDYRFDAKAPGSGLAWGPDNATGVMTCDGAWHLLPKSISDEMLLRLFQMDDGMPVRVE